MVMVGVGTVYGLWSTVCGLQVASVTLWLSIGPKPKPKPLDSLAASPSLCLCRACVLGDDGGGGGGGSSSHYTTSTEAEAA